jgi:hypothetical protein
MATSKPTVTESLQYFQSTLQKPRLEFLVYAEARGAVTEEVRKLEILHLANIEAVLRTYDGFVNGAQS